MARMLCTNCRTHRPDSLKHCQVCGSIESTPVRPSPGDLSAIEHDVLEAAMAVDRALLTGLMVAPLHPVAMRLRSACRELAFARVGILNR